jgi:hypothetical protein
VRHAEKFRLRRKKPRRGADPAALGEQHSRRRS